MNFFSRKWNNKPLPNSLLSYKCLRTSWSQFAEDLLLAEILSHVSTAGFYVDIGCFHPVIYSNTYLFYRRGWSGICVDPSPTTAQEWRKQRPRDIMVTAGVGPTKASMLYFHFEDQPACNCLVRKEERTQAESIRKPDRVSEIDVLPLAALLEQHVTIGRQIDLMSIDCEGLDFEVLKSNDFDRFRPRVLVVEDHDLSSTTDITRFMTSIGMRPVAQALISKIFVDDSVQFPWSSALPR
jgi:FkbM family methyltransferase